MCVRTYNKNKGDEVPEKIVFHILVFFLFSIHVYHEISGEKNYSKINFITRITLEEVVILLDLNLYLQKIGKQFLATGLV